MQWTSIKRKSKKGQKIAKYTLGSLSRFFTLLVLVLGPPRISQTGSSLKGEFCILKNLRFWFQSYFVSYFLEENECKNGCRILWSKWRRFVGDRYMDWDPGRLSSKSEIICIFTFFLKKFPRKLIFPKFIQFYPLYYRLN